MANRLGCDFADTTAAIAPASSGYLGSQQYNPIRSISVLVFHGSNDTVIPYYGDEHEWPSVRTWVEDWAERKRCDLIPYQSHPHPSIDKEVREKCAQDTIVILYSIDYVGPGMPSLAHNPELTSVVSALR